MFADYLLEMICCRLF